MEVTLRDDAQVCSFSFCSPEPQKWGRQKGEHLIGVETGLQKPFEKVFVKRVHGKAEAHTLLLKLVGRRITGTPRVRGYEKDGLKHLYFFENLPPSYKLLYSQLSGDHIIRPEVVRAVVAQSVEVFKVLYEHGYVYIDFCTRNIMLDEHRHVAIIDIDSSWPITLLQTKEPDGAEVRAEFWELWKKLNKGTRNKLVNAPKTVVLSFVALWSRAIALKHRPPRYNPHAALKLVRSPDEQHVLWEAFEHQNRRGFLNYFMLGQVSAGAVYNQWQRMFDDLQNGRELPWRELTGATENLLAAIDGAHKAQGRPKTAAAIATATSQRMIQGPASPQFVIGPPPVIVTPPVGSPVVVVPASGLLRKLQNAGWDFTVGVFEGLWNPFNVFNRWDK